MSVEFQHLPEALEAFGAKVAIVLGSGLNSFVESLTIEDTVPYGAIEGLPSSGVPGHHGQFALARAHGHPLLVAQGRAHLYEGWSAREATAGIRLLHRIGVQKLILTNAAGTLNPAFPPGGWMLLTDHLNLTGATPLSGGPHFIDLTEVYSPAIRGHLRAASAETGIPLAEGVYAGLRGPEYETPAEIRMLRVLGADAVGMSTVLEAIQARALGLEVGALSCLANWAAGITGATLSHLDVTSASAAAAGSLATLLDAALPRIFPD